MSDQLTDQQISLLLGQLPLLPDIWDAKLQELATAKAVTAQLQGQQMQLQDENTKLADGYSKLPR